MRTQWVEAIPHQGQLIWLLGQPNTLGRVVPSPDVSGKSGSSRSTLQTVMARLWGAETLVFILVGMKGSRNMLLIFLILLAMVPQGQQGAGWSSAVPLGEWAAQQCGAGSQESRKQWLTPDFRVGCTQWQYGFSPGQEAQETRSWKSF